MIRVGGRGGGLDLAWERDLRVLVRAWLDRGAREFVVHRGHAEGEFATVLPRLPEGAEPRIWLEVRRLSGSTGPASALRRGEVQRGDFPAIPRLPEYLLPAVLPSLAFLVWLDG